MNKKYFRATLIFLFVFALFFLKTRETGDMVFWRKWAVAIFENGFSNIYKTEKVDYVPIVLYIIGLFTLYQSNLVSLKANVFQLKAFFWLFDVLGVYFASKWLQKKGFNPFLTLIILLNLAYWYNSIIWGQVDGLYTNLVLVSLFWALDKKTLGSVLLFLLAFNTKLQAIIFLPILGILLLPQFIEKKQRIWQSILLILLTEAIIYAPFIFSDTLPLAFGVFKSAIGRYPYLSYQAYNWWYYLMLHSQVGFIDTYKFGYFSLRNWGLLAFFSFSGITLILLMSRVAYLTIKKQVYQIQDYKLIFLIFAMIQIYFFFFNTEMHERYLHSSIIFCGIYAILSKDYWMYALLSFAYMQNISGFMGSKIIPVFLDNHNLSSFRIIWNPTIVAFELTILIIYMNIRLFSLSNLRNEIREIIFSKNRY